MSSCNDDFAYNKFGQQNQIIMNGQDDDNDFEKDQLVQTENEHGEDEEKTEEQIGEEDLHFPPSFVCWSQPVPVVITSASSTAFYSSSSSSSSATADAGDVAGGGDGEHAENDIVPQPQQKPQNGECLFEQIAKLVEMNDNFENGIVGPAKMKSGDDQQQIPNGHGISRDEDDDNQMVVMSPSCQSSPVLNGDSSANAVVVVTAISPKIGNDKSWAPPSSVTTSASSSARRKSFNPVRIKEEPEQTAGNDGHQDGVGAEPTAIEQQLQQQPHPHAFTKRHDEGEEGADDEQMGPINRQQIGNKQLNLFLNDNNISTVNNCTNPLNAFVHFPPHLFPLEADEEESSDGQLNKDDDEASVREKKVSHNNLDYLARFLKNELVGACAGAVDKVVGDFSTNSSSSSSVSASNSSSADNHNDHIDEEQYGQQQHQQQQNAIQQQQQQQFQAVQARLWTAALALAATRQQQHHVQVDQQQPQQFVPTAAGSCRPPQLQPSFSLTSSMVPSSGPMHSGGLMMAPVTPTPPFPWFSVPPPTNTATFATLFAASQQNPFFSTAIGAFLANAAAQSTPVPTSRGGGGIFPPPPVPTQSTMSAHNMLADQPNLNSGAGNAISAQCSPTNGHHHHHHHHHHQQSHQNNNYPLRLSHRSSADCDDSPRRKRAKVTDCVRGPRSSLHREFAAFSTSNTPQQQQQSASAVVMPTMVTRASELDSHGRRGVMALRCSGDQNAIDGLVGIDGTGQMNAASNDELPAISINPHRHFHRLTHMHLRKAKLMFFYQRYPTSSLLKSYFPDVQFQKNNTAQLVKWFSNFREFFYMQMEKFAKEAIAKGVTRAEEIYVTTDSEVYKQLQQHYNKNNAFQPPERLLFVIQETLREFYNALKEGRDSEPSWKKAIYKVIQQLDEPIPEFFREPQFVELLEQNG